MNDIILNTIKKYEVKGDFNYASVTDDMISDAEEILGVKLPNQYVDYIKMFGHGGIAGVEILGVGLTGKMIFVESTLEYRADELPGNLVVIENVDEWLMCLDCDTGKVVSWDFTGYIKEEYDLKKGDIVVFHITEFERGHVYLSITASGKDPIFLVDSYNFGYQKFGIESDGHYRIEISGEKMTGIVEVTIK